MIIIDDVDGISFQVGCKIEYEFAVGHVGHHIKNEVIVSTFLAALQLSIE